MGKARSPIERMIDEACGYDPNRAVNNPPENNPDLVRLECPRCRRSKWAHIEKSDPEGTRRVVSPCPDCCDNVNKANPVSYFDADGKELFAHD